MKSSLLKIVKIVKFVHKQAEKPCTGWKIAQTAYTLQITSICLGYCLKPQWENVFLLGISTCVPYASEQPEENNSSKTAEITELTKKYF